MALIKDDMIEAGVRHQTNGCGFVSWVWHACVMTGEVVHTHVPQSPSSM